VRRGEFRDFGFLSWGLLFSFSVSYLIADPSGSVRGVVFTKIMLRQKFEIIPPQHNNASLKNISD